MRPLNGRNSLRSYLEAVYVLQTGVAALRGYVGFVSHSTPYREAVREP